MYDDPNNHPRRQEVKHGGINNDELPHKKKAKKKKRIKHAHVWYEHRRLDWFSGGNIWIWEKCEICGKDRDRYED